MLPPSPLWPLLTQSEFDLSAVKLRAVVFLDDSITGCLHRLKIRLHLETPTHTDTATIA